MCKLCILLNSTHLLLYDGTSQRKYGRKVRTWGYVQQQVLVSIGRGKIVTD